MYGVAARRLGLQAFGGLPRLAEISPCESAAFRRMPAFFMASVRSGPAGMRRACSRATNASASKSNLDRGFFLSWDIEILRRHSYVAGSAMSVRCTTQEPSTTAGALFYRWLSLRPAISSYWCIMSEQTLRVVPRKKAVSTQGSLPGNAFPGGFPSASAFPAPGTERRSRRRRDRWHSRPCGRAGR